MTNLIVMNSIISLEKTALEQVGDFIVTAGPILLAILSVFSSIYIARMNFKDKRKNVIYENKKDIYLQAYSILNRITLEHTVYKNKEYMEELNLLSAQIDFFGSKKIRDKFREIKALIVFSSITLHKSMDNINKGISRINSYIDEKRKVEDELEEYDGVYDYFSSGAVSGNKEEFVKERNKILNEISMWDTKIDKEREELINRLGRDDFESMTEIEDEIAEGCNPMGSEYRKKMDSLLELMTKEIIKNK